MRTNSLIPVIIPRLIALGLTLGLIASGPTARALAGIIVMKNGNVFQGRLLRQEITETHVRMRWPYKQFRGPEEGLERGYIDFEKERIRWFDSESDNLTEDYFKKFGEEELDGRFRDELELWRDKKKAEATIRTPLHDPLIKLTTGPKLVAIPVQKTFYEIKKPHAWIARDVSVEGDSQGDATIFMLVAPGSERGFAARIHILTTSRPKGTHQDQLRWYDQEISKAAIDGKVAVKVPPKIEAVGAIRKNVIATTATEVPGVGTVMALRAMRFRQERVYVVTCYAHVEDFPKLKPLFEKCLESLVIYEDEREPGR